MSGLTMADQKHSSERKGSPQKMKNTGTTGKDGTGQISTPQKIAPKEPISLELRYCHTLTPNLSLYGTERNGGANHESILNTSSQIRCKTR